MREYPAAISMKVIATKVKTADLKPGDLLQVKTTGTHWCLIISPLWANEFIYVLICHVQ